jgi:hypothetical protein
MNRTQFIKNIEKQYKELAAPYGLDHAKVESLLAELDKWQRNPDNDCLRARGDWAWIEACTLTGKLRRLLEPF